MNMKGSVGLWQVVPGLGGDSFKLIGHSETTHCSMQTLPTPWPHGLEGVAAIQQR